MPKFSLFIFNVIILLSSINSWLLILILEVDNCSHDSSILISTLTLFDSFVLSLISIVILLDLFVGSLISIVILLNLFVGSLEDSLTLILLDSFIDSLEDSLILILFVSYIFSIWLIFIFICSKILFNFFLLNFVFFI